MKKTDRESKRLVAEYGLVLGRRTAHSQLVLDPETGAVVASIARTTSDRRSIYNLRSTLARYLESKETA